MLVDWFTVVAQAINFVILVWLLKHFLYERILAVIDAREQQIAKVIADADATRAAAAQDRELFRQKSTQFDQERTGLLARATEDANAERKRLLDDARNAAGVMATQRQEALLNDAKNLNSALTRRVQQEVFAIARQALTDLAGASLEERVAVAFTRCLRTMEGQAKSALASALKSTAAPALVRSAIELPADQRMMMQTAINEAFSADIQLRFETAPDLISGIELSANGTKVAWSIAGYLAELELSVDTLMKAQAPTVKPASSTPADEHAA